MMRCYQLPMSIVPHFSFYLSFPSCISLTTKSDCCAHQHFHIRPTVRAYKWKRNSWSNDSSHVSLFLSFKPILRSSLLLSILLRFIPSMRFYYIYRDFTRYFCRHVQFRISFPPLLSTLDRIRSNQVARNGPILSE